MVVNITKALVALHNYLMAGREYGAPSRYCPRGFVDSESPTGAHLRGEWRSLVENDQGMQPLRRAGSNNYARAAKCVREDFSEYFMSGVGQVPWQWRSAHISENAFFIETRRLLRR